MIFRKLTILALSGLTIFGTNCQNATESVADTTEVATQATNTLEFKLDGNAVKIEDIKLTRNASETFIGKEANGSYVLVETGAALASGQFDNASTPKYYLQYNAGGGVSYFSDGAGTNVTFQVTVANGVVSGTFSGSARRNDGQTVVISEGKFRCPG